MDVIAIDDPTEQQLRQWHAVLTAVHAAGPTPLDVAAEPGPVEDPPPEMEQTSALLLGGYPGTRLKLWAAVDGGADGTMAGVVSLRLPGGPGADRPAEVDIQVRPERRRQGVGGRLLRVAASGLRADGRTSVITQVQAGTPAVPFLESHGFRCVLTLRGMLLRLSDVDPLRLAWLARSGPPGYRLVRWTGEVPAEFAGPLAQAKRAMADVPEHEGGRWNATRVREMAEMVAERGDALYTVAAVHGGDVAGFTEIVVPAEAPERAAQYDTAVVPEHRGRRLGLWVKAAMLNWLMRERPEVRDIETDNAGDNVHMLAVNEELGFRRLYESREYQARAADLP